MPWTNEASYCAFKGLNSIFCHQWFAEHQGEKISILNQIQERAMHKDFLSYAINFPLKLDVDLVILWGL